MSNFTFKPADWIPYGTFDPGMMARLRAMTKEDILAPNPKSKAKIIVTTGVDVTVCTKTRALTEVDLTGVTFRPLSEAEIAAYVEGGEPMDKAGAYGAQGLGSIFVERLDGDYFNVMGLPLCRLSRMLERFGIAILGGVGERGTL